MCLIWFLHLYWDVFENICIRLVCASCVWIVLCCVLCVSVAICIRIACMFGKCIMGLSYLQHRHVFRLWLFHIKCMPATLNACSLHLRIYAHCGVCARLTWLFLQVNTHWRTIKGAAMAKECKPDCFLPPPHRGLYLHGNQVSSLPDSVFGGLSALT
jgi:hypothetical protein